MSTAVLASSALALPTAFEKRVESEPRLPNATVSAWTQEGQASWYGSRYHGRSTASGEKFDMGIQQARIVALEQFL